MNNLAIIGELDVRMGEVALVLNIKPKTLQKRLNNLLPHPIQQSIFLKFATDYALSVEEGANMIELFTSPHRIHDGDDTWVTVGENLVVNKVDKIESEIMIALQLSCPDAEEDGIKIDRSTSVAMVLLFGEFCNNLIMDLQRCSSDFGYALKLDSSAKDRFVLRRTITAVIRLSWSDMETKERIPCYRADEFLERFERMTSKEVKELCEEIQWEEVSERYSK